MSFYSSEFFAGCESLMEDETNLPAEDLPVEEAVVEQQEAADAAAEPVEAIAEQEEVAEATEQMFAKFDEIDRMIAYVGQYGVDKSFLSLCNHNDILNRSFGLGLPATESFDEAGDPNSAVSQAAMEGLKEAAKSVWDWFIGVLTKIRDWFKRMWNKFIGFFKKNADDAKKVAKAASETKELPPDQQDKGAAEQGATPSGIAAANAEIDKEAKAATELLKQVSAANAETAGATVSKATETFRIAKDPKGFIDETLKAIKDKGVTSDLLKQKDMAQFNRIIDALEKEVDGLNAMAESLQRDIDKELETVNRCKHNLKQDLDREDRDLEIALRDKHQAEIDALRTRQSILVKSAEAKTKLILESKRTCKSYLKVNNAAKQKKMNQTISAA